jgi:ABC-type lipoprotein release transport system permease subunit
MRKLALLLPLAWRSLWRNPRRTLITLVVIAVGMWSILIFDVMFAAVGQSSRDQALKVMTGEGQIHAAGYINDPNVTYSFPFPTGALLGVLNSSQIEAWTARVRVPAILQSEYETRPVTLAGVSPASEARISILPSSIAAGRYLAGDSDAGIVLGRDLVTHLKTRLGKRVILMTQAKDGHLSQQGFVIVGIYGATQPVEDEFVFTGRATAQTLLGIGSDVSEISFDARPEGALDTVVAELKQAWTADRPDANLSTNHHGPIQSGHPASRARLWPTAVGHLREQTSQRSNTPGWPAFAGHGELRGSGPGHGEYVALDIEPWTQFSPIAAAIESVSSTYTAVWLLIMFVLMAIGIVNTQLMAVFERTREFGLLQALGMRPSMIVFMVSVESAMLVGLGVAAGIGLAALTLAPFSHGLDLGFLASGIDRYGLGRFLYPKLDPAIAIGPGLTVWVLGILATLWPARRAARTAPVVAMAQA